MASRGRNSAARYDAMDECDEYVDQAARVSRETKQLGQLTDEDRQCQAVHIADLGWLRQQVGDEAQAGKGADDHQSTDH